MKKLCENNKKIVRNEGGVNQQQRSKWKKPSPTSGLNRQTKCQEPAVGKPKGTIQSSKFDADGEKIEELPGLGLSIRKIAKHLGYIAVTFGPDVKEKRQLSLLDQGFILELSPQVPRRAMALR